MLTLQKLFFGFITAHFFIAGIAVILTLETAVVLHAPFQPISVYLFIFFATFFAYNVYYIHTENGHIYKMFAILSLVCSLFVLFFVPSLYYLKLVPIAIASTLYIFPVFVTYDRSPSFAIYRLLLLVFVWVATTFILPINPLQYNYATFVLLVYRIVLIALACILFFIRDELDVVLKRKAIVSAWALHFLQIILATIVTFTVNVTFGICYLALSILSILVTSRFLKKSQTAVHYLMFVDGVLFLQGFSILIIYFLELS